MADKNPTELKIFVLMEIEGTGEQTELGWFTLHRENWRVEFPVKFGLAADEIIEAFEEERDSDAGA